ncbi:MAG: hypothetical protein P4L51_20585 [Puia sp.]|nr:hypothetical protein [Puia sp.]
MIGTRSAARTWLEHFAYRFGNTRDITPWPSSPAPLLLARLSTSPAMLNSIALTYKTMLAAVCTQDTQQLQRMLERQLFTRLECDMKGLKNAGCELRIKNPEKEIRVVAKDVWLVVTCDRAAEARIISEFPFFQQHHVRLYTSALMRELHAILRVKTEIRTSFGLEVRDGQQMFLPGPEGKEELHELCVEGLATGPFHMKDASTRVMQILGMTQGRGLGFDQVKVVDLDNAAALQGDWSV